jgi:leucyl aminopeptidase
MKLHHKESTSKLPATDLLALFVLEGDKPALPAGVELAKVALEGFKGEFRELRSTEALAGPARRVALIGLGKKNALDRERCRRVAALAVQRAENLGAAACTLLVEDELARLVGPAELGEALAEGALLGAYTWQKGKTKPKDGKLKTTAIVGKGQALARGVEKGRILAQANAFTRDLQNEPGNRLTPRDLAAAAKSLVKGNRIHCRVLDPKQMKKLGMGLLLGVAAGSREEPRFIHLEYKPKGKSKGRIAFVGKGLTFDAGGISLKPSAKMDEMRFDMSGGAAVLGAFHALRHIDVPFEVHGVVPTSENLPGDRATKPGDIHIAMNGTSVEVLNTDAEGRLILADALAYTIEKIKPDTIIDLATLTGAVTVALGHELAGLFASTNQLRDDLLAAGEETGERLWSLPLLDYHKEQMKGLFADLKNISGGDMGAGASAGAAFLSAFVGDTEWAHIDMAGTAWGGSNRDWVGGPMGSGYGARLLMRYLELRT